MSENTRSLVAHIEAAITSSLDENLFDVSTNSPDYVKAAVTKYLDGIKSNIGLTDYSLNNIRLCTWKENYPDPVKRQLAIEAVEKYGSVIYPYNHSKEELATILSYPYTQEVTYRVTIEEDGETYIEHFSEWPDYDDNIIKIEKKVSYHINDPTDKYIIDVYMVPTAPIEYINFNIVINENGVEL